MIFSKKLASNESSRPIYYYFPHSFFSVWAFMRAGGISTRSILTPVLFILCAMFFRYVHRLFTVADTFALKASGSLRASDFSESSGFSGFRRLRLTALAAGLLFTLLYLLAARASLTEGLNNRLFQAVILAACAIGLFLLFFHTLLLIFFYSVSFMIKKEDAPIPALPIVSFFLCLLCWLPYYLYEYPGIMTPDSINQFEQVLGMVPYSNHHPWAHTMLIGLFYHIGRLFTSDIPTALSFYTVFQMCFMAFAAAWLISTLQKCRIKNIFCFLTTAFYALTPYHGVFSVTIWKDIMFSGAVLLFTSALLRIVFLFPASAGVTADAADRTLRQRFLGIKEKTAVLAVYIISGWMLCLFRSNGWYAFLFSLPFLLLAFRRSLRLMLPIHIAILTAAVIVKGPVMDAYQVAQPDFVESICIPLQQVARVICEDKELTQEEWDLVHSVMDTSYIKELYSSGFADNMKELARAGHPEYLASHKGEYLKLWLSLGLRYPSVYLQAHIDQTIGYWYPDTEYTVADIDGIIANDTGASSRPLIGGPLVVKTKEILLKLGDILPLYGLLSSMGAMFWALLVLIAITIVKKQHDRYILFLPGLAVILTLFIATPVASEFRYAYSLAYTLPLYFMIPFIDRETNY